MVIGGYLVDHFGKMKMLTLYLGLITAIISTFAFAGGFWSNTIFVCGFIFVYYVLYIFLCIAIFASGMHLCWKTVAATQFTLYMAVSNMGRAAGSAILGYLESNFNWEIVFIITSAMPLIMGIVLRDTVP